MADYIHKGYINAPEDENFDIRYEFVIVSSEELSLQNDVTQYVVEDGSTKQEHIVQQPITFTIEGLVAQKVHVAKLENFTSGLAQQASKLQPIAAFFPTASSYMSAAIAGANAAERTVRKVYDKIKALKAWGGNPEASLNLQRLVASELKVLSRTRTLVGVTSDLGTYKNMVIKSVSMIQEDTHDQSRLRIELQQYNSVSTQLTTVDTQKYSGRVAQQSAAIQNLGKIQGKTMSTLRSWVSPTIVPYFTGVK